MANTSATYGTPLSEADISGIGQRIVARLADVGVGTVGDLARADVDELYQQLRSSWSSLSRALVFTWVQDAHRVLGRIPDSEEAPPKNTGETRHAFILTLWVRPDGTASRSRYSLSIPDTTPEDRPGWSPAAFAAFVASQAGLRSQVRVVPDPSGGGVAEWRGYAVQADLVRESSDVPVAATAHIGTDKLGDEPRPLKWRATGRLRELGTRRHHPLGKLNGVLSGDEDINLSFPPQPVPEGLHRVEIEVEVSPPPETTGYLYVQGRKEEAMTGAA